jgi:hypothetical protein
VVEKMAILLSKEDLVKLKSPAEEVKASSSDYFSKILDFLNNPVIQNILQRIVDKFLPANPSNPVNPINPIQEDSKERAERILSSIEAILKTLPEETTVKDLKEDLSKEREKFLSVIENAIKLKVI